MELLFATTNAGKLTEAQACLAASAWRLLSLTDFPQLVGMDVEETGKTFAKNALLKAQAYGSLTGVLTVAEDAGLAVNALDGKPGVYSARYAESDQARNTRLLSELTGFEDRTAQFISVLCLYDPVADTAEYFTGTVEGTIADQPKGEAGFGYDPIFIPDGYTQTFAELGIEQKNKLSHRAKALQKLAEYLNKTKQS